MASNKQKPTGKAAQPPKGINEGVSTRAELLRMIEGFLSQNPHIRPEQFGWEVCGDSKLVDRLRSGGDVTTRKLDIILKYLSQFQRSTKK